MQILKGMRYRVYLQEEQEEFLRQVSGCVRFVYNIGLEQQRLDRPDAHNTQSGFERWLTI